MNNFIGWSKLPDSQINITEEPFDYTDKQGPVTAAGNPKAKHLKAS
jgi:hypothetical protein